MVLGGLVHWILRPWRCPRSPWGGGSAALAFAVASLPLVPAGQVRAAVPLVVAGDGILCDLTRTLASDQARVVCLIPPGADPHQAVLRPSDRQALAEARLVLINGYNLSPALARIPSRARRVAVAELAVPGSPGRDPHVWHDPAQAAAMARVVEAELKPVLAGAAGVGLRRRGQAVGGVLSELGRWAEVQIDSVPPRARVLVTEHRAFSSLARRFGLRELPLLDAFTTAGVLRPASLAAMAKAVRDSGTRQMFAEALPISKTLRRISRASGVPVNPTPLVADGLAPGRSTVQTATGNVCTVVQGQGGRCDSAGADRLAQRWAAIR
ncbi:MAG: metal ABC transporter substrate-binding protein [Cyanobacteriota bacterium]|nr:metal ABC transporter substrate-binding protein [Cyanobacteriota bacterium]